MLNPFSLVLTIKSLDVINGSDLETLNLAVSSFPPRASGTVFTATDVALGQEVATFSLFWVLSLAFSIGGN